MEDPATAGAVEAKDVAVEAVAEVAKMVVAAKVVDATGVVRIDGDRRLERPVRRIVPHTCSRQLVGA